MLTLLFGASGVFGIVSTTRAATQTIDNETSVFSDYAASSTGVSHSFSFDISQPLSQGDRIIFTFPPQLGALTSFSTGSNLGENPTFSLNENQIITTIGSGGALTGTITLSGSTANNSSSGQVAISVMTIDPDDQVFETGYFIVSFGNTVSIIVDLDNPTPPPDVNNFLSIPGNSMVDLSWSPHPDRNIYNNLSHYVVYLNDSTGYGPGISVDSGAVSLHIEGLTNGVTYLAKITTATIYATESTGAVLVFAPNGGGSQNDPNNIDSTPPGPPTNQQTSFSGSDVSLSWIEPSDPDLQDIVIYRAIGSTLWGQYAIIPAGSGSYLDTDVINGNTYHYRVRARDTSSNESTNLDDLVMVADFSTPDTAVIPLSSYQSTSTFDIGYTVAGVSSYTELYYSRDSGPYTLYGSGSSTFSFDTTLTGGDGVYDFYTIGYGLMNGPESAPTSADTTTTVDTTPPTSSITASLTPSSDGQRYSSTSLITLDSSITETGSGIDHYEVYVFSGANPILHTDLDHPDGFFSAPSISFDASLYRGEDSYEIYSIAVDTVGNREPDKAIADSSFIIDSTPPIGSFVDKYSNTPTLELLLSGNSDTFEMYISGDLDITSANSGSWIPFISNPEITLSTGDGTKNINVSLRDRAGNQTQMNGQIILDTVPPEVNVNLNNGNNTTTELLVPFTLTGSTDLYQINIDGNLLNNQNTFSWIPASSTLDLTLTETMGIKTIRIRGRDQALNETEIFKVITLSPVPSTPTSTGSTTPTPTPTPTPNILFTPTSTSTSGGGGGGININVERSDPDKDGLDNGNENIYGTDPNDPDSDDDGLNDFEEVITYSTNPLLTDTDGDTLSDFAEVTQYLTNPNLEDTDGDTFPDAEELSAGTDPLDPDSFPQYSEDADVSANWLDKYFADSSTGSTIPSSTGAVTATGDIVVEVSPKPTPTPQIDLGSRDTDGDGLSDQKEYLFRTSPLSADTDGDGFTDGEEILEYFTDPLDADSHPGENINIQITNLKNGDILSDSTPTIKGIANPLQTIAIYYRTETGANTLASTLLSDEAGKFVYLVDTKLEDDNYDIQAVEQDSTGEVIAWSAVVKIQINTTLNIPSPFIQGFDTGSVQAVNDIYITSNPQPTIFGTTFFGSEIVATWQSLVTTSTAIASSQSGEFFLSAPKPLDEGSHIVTLYATMPDSGERSEESLFRFEVVLDLEAREVAKKQLLVIILGITIATTLIYLLVVTRGRPRPIQIGRIRFEDLEDK